MKNAYFNRKDLSVLLSHSQLKLVSSFLSDIAPVKPDKKYLKWINENSTNHDYREVMLTLSGTTYFTLEGTTYLCEPGTVFLIDSNEEHDFYYPPFNDNFKHLWFRIVNKTILTSSYCRINGKTINSINFNYNFNEYNHSGCLFKNIWNELSADHNIHNDFKKLYIKHAFAGLTMELCKVGYSKLLKTVETPTEHHHQTVIDAIAGHIRTTGGRNLDVAKLACIAGYSKFHFARIFKELTGFSVLRFINICRIDKYKELSAKGLNKKQISYELGFSCPASFSRWLRDTLSDEICTKRGGN
jgi:AraC-like DNA-binding protein